MPKSDLQLMVEQFFKKGFSLEMCENSAAKLIIEIL